MEFLPLFMTMQEWIQKDVDALFPFGWPPTQKSDRHVSQLSMTNNDPMKCQIPSRCCVGYNSQIIVVRIMVMLSNCFQ